MKAILFIAFISILFVGCSKKNNPSPNTNPASISGKWYVISDSTWEYQNGILQGINTANYSRTNYYQFNNDGSGLVFNFGLQSSTDFNYVIADKTLTLNYPAQIVKGISLSSNTENYLIKLFTTNNLTITYSDTGIINGINYANNEILYLDR